MDLKHPNITTTTTTDSPDTEGETETKTPLHSHLIKPFSSFNKNHHHLNNNHHHNHQQQQQVVAYKECLKNHAATIGSHALDGCGEFMPSLTTVPHEPTSLKCAACGCHRNFHRREHINDVYAYAPHVLLSFNAATDHQNQMVAMPGTPAEVKIENPNGRKRFRTKFSQDQKEKMHLFAEKVGWKMQRCDDKVVMEFCNEVGIKRGIFKVWMHNNKNTFGKKDINKDTSTNSPASPVSPATGTVIAGGGATEKSIDVYNNGRVVNSSDEQENGGGGVHLHASNNVSCSSS